MNLLFVFNFNFNQFWGLQSKFIFSGSISYDKEEDYLEFIEFYFD